MTITEILAKLISFPAIGGESNLDLITWIDQYIQQFGVTTYLVPNVEGTKASLHCRIGPAVDGGVVLSGHTDVVPVKGQKWVTEPFTLTDKGDGKLYGRGTCDMKGFIACCLGLLPQIIDADLQQPIYFAFSYDEEIGCVGAPELIDNLLSSYDEKPRSAIIGEPSLLQPITGQKSICMIKTTVNGSAGHSSRILQEVSAVHESAKLILWIENKMKTLLKDKRVDHRFSPPHSSLHVGQIQGGVAVNVIADHTEFVWDIRAIPSDDTLSIIDDFRVYCQEREEQNRSAFPDFKIEIDIITSPVPSLDTDEDAYTTNLVKRITNTNEVSAVSYATEAGQFAERGIESIICGPGDIAQAHKANEFVTKEQLDGCELMLLNLIALLEEG